MVPVAVGGRSGSRGPAIATAIVAVLAVVSWSWQARSIDLVIVNQSGVDAQLTWRPAALVQDETITIGGCESKSMVMHAEGWRLMAGNLDLSADAVRLPWATKLVELEVWLDPDGSSRTVGPREVPDLVNAPVPTACGPQP